MELNESPINIFDFDGTLTTETWPKFWVWVKKFGYSGEKRNDKLEKALNEYRKKVKGSLLETFFSFFNDLLESRNETISYEELMEGKKYIVYNPGIEEFIKNTNAKNYIVSGGLKEFMDNLKISKNFEKIYGTSVKQNTDGLIYGIEKAMTNDKKIFAILDILRENGRIENDCKNVYYLGDGYSDAEAMQFVHNNGGKAIFVHQPDENDELYNHNKKIYEDLNKNGMIDYYCEADYRDGTKLSNILKRQY